MNVTLIWHTQSHHRNPIFLKWQQINSDIVKSNIEILKKISNAIAKWGLTDEKPGLFDISNTAPIYIQDNTWLPVCLQMCKRQTGLAINRHYID